MFSILRRLTCFICLRMLQPSRMASPDVTELCPVNILNAVVLPESLTPRRQRISAFLTPNVNPSTQRTPPYSLTRSLGSHINCNQLHSITINYNQLQSITINYSDWIKRRARSARLLDDERVWLSQRFFRRGEDVFPLGLDPGVLLRPAGHLPHLGFHDVINSFKWIP